MYYSSSSNMSRKPLHLSIKVLRGPNFHRLKNMLKDLRLKTVCESADCPNIFECFEAGTATFLLLGDTCTRNCCFCKVSYGKPLSPDEDEPSRVAKAIAALDLHYSVITSVTRDDLLDGGANMFVKTLQSIRDKSPRCRTEVLIPDFAGNRNALQTVVEAAPSVLSHNIETVPRLYDSVRQGADYQRSLLLLKQTKEMGFNGYTKSGIMVGMGEDKSELVRTLHDLRTHDCELVTIGQYLAPSKKHFPVARFYALAEFKELEIIAYKLGFKHVESGPLVRSSYRAGNRL